MLTHDVIAYDDLQSLTGFLSFAAKVVRPGRAFLRRLFDALTNCRRHIRIFPETKADLEWWNYFLTCHLAARQKMQKEFQSILDGTEFRC